jgi:hypothetical protein
MLPSEHTKFECILQRNQRRRPRRKKLEPIVPETPTPRYDRAFLAKIFNKNRETNTSQGANPVATTTPIQSSTIMQSPKTNVNPQQNTSGTPQLTTPSTTVPSTSKQKAPTTASKSSSSSIGKAANVTPAQPTLILSQATTKPIPVAQMQPKLGNYYSKLAARRYNQADSDDSNSDSDSSSSSSSDENPPRLDPNKITKEEESSSSEEDSRDDESSNEEAMRIAIQRSLGIPVPMPAKKIAYKKTAEDKKPAAKKVTDTKQLVDPIRDSLYVQSTVVRFPLSDTLGAHLFKS